MMHFNRKGTRLKDAALSLDKLREGYVEMIMAMRTLYQKCKLVHGDLSEYNILYFEGHLHIIDVSQAVDPDHPHALDFLPEDCEFFKKHGVAVMTIRELFDFTVDASIADDVGDSYLEEVQQNFLARGDVSVEDEIADRVCAEDVQRITSGKDTGDLYYQTITGLKNALSRTQSSLRNDRQQQKSNPKEDSPIISDGKPSLIEGVAESQSEEDEDNGSGYEEDSSCESEVEAPVDKKAARKENKKKVKEEKREAHKHKVPKAVQKRKKKLARAPKTR